MQKTKFKIQGIKCGNCSLLIEEKIKNKEGVVKIKVDNDSNKGVVIFDEQKITEQDIYQAIENINDFHLEKIKEVAQPSEIENKEQNSNVKKVKFKISGLKCDNCVLLIESRLKDKEGVVKVKIDQTSNKVVVIYDEQKIDESDIYKIIEEIGGFKVEKIEQAEEGIENNLNYSNPEKERDTKPPIEAKNNRGAYAFVTVVAILSMLFSLGPKNNQAQVGGSAQDTVQNQQQVQQPSGAQQQPTTTLTKSDNPTLEAYVVARCPYGLQMQRAMADAVKNIPSLGQYIKVRYIGSVSGDGKTITAMHGNAEAQENLRQICIREEQPNKYWDYVSCDMKSGDSAGCEKSTGVDSAKLSSCISDSSRGVAYAKKDFALSNQYSIQGSPTLILNGAQVSESSYGGRSSDGVKAMVCTAFNSLPSFCSTKLTTVQAATSFSETY